MLSGNESISRYTPSNIAIWMVLAFQAGILNIGGFMACGHFVSHVTGLVTLFGFELSQTHYDRAFGFLVVPVFFLLGSMLSGYVVDLRLKLHQRPNYYLSFGLIFVLVSFVCVAGIYEYFGKFGKEIHSNRELLLVAILCFVCGIQNGTITSVSKSVVRTSHLTGIITDLGIGVVRVLNRHRIQSSLDDEVKANFMRVGLILFFAIGSMVGGLAYHEMSYYGFIIPTVTSGTLFAVAIYFRHFSRRARA